MDETELVHEFRPRDEAGDEADFVVATCTCGWRGDRFPEGTEAYAEAREQYSRHLEPIDEDESLEAPTPPPLTP